ncbi:MAG: permease [Candidatus Omnitrophica bacterium]|nr:permease [Candidatus Omnitrophota bacterium]HOX54596.1 permease [Candidatus Omnitrophota bacterium]
MAKDPICGMAVDEKSGLKLNFKGQDYFFCSQRCLEKFAKDNAISSELVNTCIVYPKIPFYRNKTFLVALALLVLSLLSFVLPFLLPFRETLLSYFQKIWWAILLGLFLGGIIDHYVPREYFSHILAKPKKRTIVYSVILGFFMSVCSHGILALSIQLHKKGASNPAVVSFLLASPWANMTITIMLISFFGLKALFIILGAIVIAINTGFIFQLLESKNLIEKNINTTVVEDNFSISADMAKRIKQYRFSLDTLKSDFKGIFNGVVSLSNMVLWWVLIGVGLASLAGAYIPTHVFTTYLGASFVGLLLTLLLATVIEVCSEGSSPMAFEIYRQTGAFGNSFVFLMAGVVTDYTEIGLLWHNVGKKTAMWLPIVTVPQVVLLGWIANKIF